MEVGALLRRQEGFTLIETVIVAAIIGILMTVGLASYRSMVDRAEEERVQFDLVAAAKVEALVHLEHGEFTADSAALSAIEPSLTYGTAADPAGTVVVVIAPGRAAIDVCIFERSRSGGWYAILHSAFGGQRFARTGPVDCVPEVTDLWDTGSW